MSIVIYMSSLSKVMPKTTSKKTEIMNTGIKINGRTVYFTKGLKNPLSGFFFKTETGKKNKILVKNVKNEKTKNAFQNILKKHANTVVPPEGKVLNPLTGRFIKAPVEKKPTTFQDPISLSNIKFEDGIQLNKQWYSKESLRTMIDTGNIRVPHSRRNITNTEINTIFTNKKGKKIARRINNSNSNNDPSSVWNVIEGTSDEDTLNFNTLEDFKNFIETIEMEEYMVFNAQVAELRADISIAEYPSTEIKIIIRAVPFSDPIEYKIAYAKIIKDGRTYEKNDLNNTNLNDMINFIKKKTPTPKRRSPPRNGNMPNIDNNGGLIF